MLIRDRVHSRLCPFGMVSIRDCVHSGWCPFGIVSIRDCVHSGSCIGSVHEKPIVLIVDESTLSGTQYLNILVGSLGIPYVSFLFDCQLLKCAPNSNIIAQAVDDAVRNLGIDRSFFYLLLSDAAKYMIAAGIRLKSFYPKLFHVTCVAHLLHNCAMTIKSHFEDVDQLIAKVKALTISSKTRRAQFSAIAYPPQPVPTRWGS